MSNVNEFTRIERNDKFDNLQANSFQQKVDVRVAQATSITTGVSADGNLVVITTQASAAAAGATESFTLTNSSILISSAVRVRVLNYGTGAATGHPLVAAVNTQAGQVDIQITNVHGAAALNASLVIEVEIV